MARRIATTRTVQDLRRRIATWRRSGKTVALVPTMGALHAGHLSLISAARKEAERVIVSIFVNPSQFGPQEDFNAYPRSEVDDATRLSRTRANLLYAPTAEEMYPPGFATKVSIGGITEDLCGPHRPHHFEGVATVVTKLLLQAAPDVAIFGEKDYQQLIMVKQLVRDLNIPVRIVGAPTVREDDGLALSSRNAYLSPTERELATFLHRTLADLASDLSEGRAGEDAAEAGRFRLESAGFRVDYVAVRDAETLEPVIGPVKTPARVLAAVHLGKTRLIDNLPVTQPKASRRAKSAPRATVA
jgi:pantoate--beta-alanine ligase